MNFRNLFLIILLSQVISSRGMVVTLEEIKDLHSSIQMALGRITENPDYKRDVPKIIIMGATGRGKTSLIHYLAEKDMMIKSDGASYSLDVSQEDRLPGFEPIGHTINAGTTLASSWYNPQTDIVYWDCPGFGDPNGPKQDIINAFSIYQLFKSSTPIKLILVASESDAKIRPGRSKEFLALLNKVTCMLPDPASYRSVSSVITQQRDHEPKILLHEIFNDLSRSTTHKFREGAVKDFLKEMITHSERISAFPVPKQPESYSTDYRERILDSINSTEYIVNPIINFFIPEEAEKLLTNYSQKTFDALDTALREEVPICLMNCCLNMVTLYSNPIRDEKELISFLREFKKDLKNLRKTDEDNFFIALESIYNKRMKKEDFDFEKVHGSLNKVKEAVEGIKFLKRMNPEVQFPKDTYVNALQTNCERIGKLYHKPIKFYEAAVEKNLPHAYKAMGIMYESGTWDEKSLFQVERNFLMGIDYYKKAVSNEFISVYPDLVPIQYRLGCFYAGILDSNHTIEKNDEEAFIWFKKASQNGHALSQYNLGLMYKKGIGVPENVLKANKWFKKAGSNNIPEASISLALLYHSQNKLGASLKWFEKAAKQGHEESQYILGKYNKASSNYKESFEWFEKAASKGHPLSLYEVALSYLEGKGTEKNLEEAISILIKLTEIPNNKAGGIGLLATLKLANMFLKDEEGEKSEAEAIKHFEEASKKGYPSAKNILKEMGREAPPR